MQNAQHFAHLLRSKRVSSNTLVLEVCKMRSILRAFCVAKARMPKCAAFWPICHSSKALCRNMTYFWQSAKFPWATIGKSPKTTIFGVIFESKHSCKADNAKIGIFCLFWQYPPYSCVFDSKTTSKNEIFRNHPNSRNPLF